MKLEYKGNASLGIIEAPGVFTEARKAASDHVRAHGGRDGVRDLTSGSQITKEAESAPADGSAGSSDEEDIWADPCGSLADPQDFTEPFPEAEYWSDAQQSSSSSGDADSPRHHEQGEGPGLQSGSMNDSALDLQEQVQQRLAESGAASTSGRDASEGSGGNQYPGHRAAFYGEVESLLEHLRSCTEEQLLQHDSQGNTVLHLAVLRQHYDTVQALIDFGYPLFCKNIRKWMPLDEAVSLRDRRMVKLLHAADIQQMKALHRAKRGALLQTMQDMDDFTFKLKWELGSPLFGLLLRRYAPHDIYEVWKKGVLMRVDGSLMGIDDKANTLIPQWKRGHFSLLFDGRPTPASLLLVDHRKQTIVDLTKERRTKRPEIDDEVSIIMSEGTCKTRMKASDFRFTKVKGWLGSDQTERIEGWKTYVYEAAGKMKAVNTVKAPSELEEGATFEEYLNTVFPDDDVKEQYIDPLSLKGAPRAMSRTSTDDDEAIDTAEEAGKAARVLTGRCWMAEGFPMSLRQLLPILDIIGTANKHLARVAKFMQKYADMELFPVKLQVPLLFTVYALVSFRGFRVLPAKGDCSSDAFYQAPPGYRLKALHESLSKDKPKHEEHSHMTDSMAELEEEGFLS